ncbi:hypothetical protein NLJ89_g11034 [Agrocybe chaxingu]|uniref:Uncharacterized protein n=1 Tax=Agrocybe chaxingu TaxID=84603 RepID=A0A9W8MRJ1_9AGAR|nr:hypothetical protein NLJ89_g11034 [Agrocybe chaxingu]
MSFALTLRLLSAVLLLRCVQCQLSTSLYIPGFDPQPISASVVGVGADGRTTWALRKGQPDATDTSSYPDFFGTATLVQGPNDASLTYADSRAQFTIGQICSFSENTLAICTIVAQGSTATQTDVVTHYPVQATGLTRDPNTTTTASLTPTPVPSSLSSLTKSSSDILAPGSGTHTSSLPINTSTSDTSSQQSGIRLTVAQIFILVGLLTLSACS